MFQILMASEPIEFLEKSKASVLAHQTPYNTPKNLDLGYVSALRLLETSVTK
jgi:hypothetical protein